VAQTRLHPADLVLPVFVREGIAEPVPISSMPGVVQHTLDSLVAEAERAVAAGLGGLMVFGVPEAKDGRGSGADDPGGILNVALTRLAEAVGDRIVVMADLCLDEFTDHGHCGVLDHSGAVDNDATLERYAAMALAQAAAGAEVLGLSGMMDGQVGHVRATLDAAGFTDTLILAYAAKYTSGLYGPFREAVQSPSSAIGRPTSRTPRMRPRRSVRSSSTSPRAPTSSWSSPASLISTSSRPLPKSRRFPLRHTRSRVSTHRSSRPPTTAGSTASGWRPSP
jgi:delta-aminolevulinic acid dehydratase/porphobilinogen synthase